MEELFNRLLEGVWNDLHSNIGFYPRVNAYKEDDSIKVNVYYPGVTKEELQVKIEDNFLIIQGDFETQKAEKEKRYLNEFSPINFTRKFRLPKDVKKKAISANYEDGVLKIVIPIDKKKEKERKFDINIG